MHEMDETQQQLKALADKLRQEKASSRQLTARVNEVKAWHAGQSSSDGTTRRADTLIPGLTAPKHDGGSMRAPRAYGNMFRAPPPAASSVFQPSSSRDTMPTGGGGSATSHHPFF